LRALDLSRNRIGAGGIEALATSPALVGLERLCLRWCSIGPSDARAFRAASRPGRLRWLLLSGSAYPQGSGPGDEGAAALAAAPWLANLRVLHLSQCEIGPAGAHALASTHHFANLHTLGLGHNPIGDQGARSLAGSPHLAGLHFLRLRNCGIGSTGAKALAASAHLAEIEQLELRDNPIRAAGLRELKARFGAAVRPSGALTSSSA
jgi:hypothetical protein